MLEYDSIFEAIADSPEEAKKMQFFADKILEQRELIGQLQDDKVNAEFIVEGQGKHLTALKGRIEELEQALKDIKRHQKIISGGMYEQTGAWQIASKVL
jgi:hypothetical protein